ncbi:MAG: acyl-CoA thioesterase [Myxococcales bacterium]|nr:acyl-CoA thioesterase [Myxococcales bacterium]
MLKTASIELEVPFHDVDALHVVWHGHYAKYYELASMNLLRQFGLDMLVIRELGYSMYVMETRFRYMHPLRYRDPFRVTSKLKEWDTCFVISNVIHKLADGQRCARARTKLVLTDTEGKLLLEVPNEIRNRLA